jgi:large subunit ribosomal protein L5
MIILIKAHKKTFHKPQINKIILNRGLGNLAQNKTILNMSLQEFRAITGQHPCFTYAKKSISTFKIREKTILGMRVVLRKKKMYSFLERLIHLILPQIREFKGFSKKQFDNSGNYHFGLKTQDIFPELDYELIKYPLGLNISIITTVTSQLQNIKLLKSFHFPFE